MMQIPSFFSLLPDLWCPYVQLMHTMKLNNCITPTNLIQIQNLDLDLNSLNLNPKSCSLLWLYMETSMLIYITPFNEMISLHKLTHGVCKFPLLLSLLCFTMLKLPSTINWRLRFEQTSYFIQVSCGWN